MLGCLFRLSVVVVCAYLALGFFLRCALPCDGDSSLSRLPVLHATDGGGARGAKALRSPPKQEMFLCVHGHLIPLP